MCYVHSLRDVAQAEKIAQQSFLQSAIDINQWDPQLAWTSDDPLMTEERWKNEDKHGLELAGALFAYCRPGSTPKQNLKLIEKAAKSVQALQEEDEEEEIAGTDLVEVSEQELAEGYKQCDALIGSFMEESAQEDLADNEIKKAEAEAYADSDSLMYHVANDHSLGEATQKLLEELKNSQRNVSLPLA